MNSPESRSYTITGELLPSQWSGLLTHIHEQGLIIEAIAIDERHEVAQNAIDVLNRADFDWFAEDTGAFQNTGRRSWTCLARFQWTKQIDVDAEYYPVYANQYPRSLQDINLIYHSLPPDGRIPLRGDESGLVGDLEVGSFDAYMSVVNTEIDARGRPINEVLGRTYGKKHLDFLNGVLDAAKEHQIPTMRQI